MIARIWATLRTAYLFFVVAYALWAMPWATPTMPKTLDEQYARCASAVEPLQRAAWLAIAWIALEAVLGWAAIWRGARTHRAAEAPPLPPTPGA